MVIILIRVLVATFSFIGAFVGFCALAVLDDKDWKGWVVIWVVFTLSVMLSFLALAAVLTPVTIE